MEEQVRNALEYAKRNRHGGFRAYEAAKRRLPPMPAEQYEKAVSEIARVLKL